MQICNLMWSLDADSFMGMFLCHNVSTKNSQRLCQIVASQFPLLIPKPDP